MKHTDLTSINVLDPVESKTMVDAFLAPILQQLIEAARHTSPHYETLWQDIEHLYQAGGKRLRSYMTLLSYEACSQKPLEAILPAAAAQELLHTAMLIHDDIIDRDDIRYGVKNIASQYLDHYEELIDDTQDRRHYANSAAILAGDLLISQAYALITEAKVDPAVIIKAQKVLTQAMFRVIGGELLDTEAAFRGTDSASPLSIAEEKTASYSFVSPFLMGATLAEASPVQCSILERLGKELGIAYQLRDDILGVFGNTTKTGKSIDSDLREGKHTLLIEAFYRLASPKQRLQFDTLFGQRTAATEDIKILKTLIIESGAKESIETLIQSYQERTHKLLDSLDIDQAHYQAFSRLIDLCVNREK